MRPFARIGEEVRRELSRFGPEAGLADIVTAWPAAVGEGIARNAWPARVSRDGTLHVATSSSAWAFELTQMASTVLARLREHAGGDTPVAIRFAVGPLPEPGEQPVDDVERTALEVDPSLRAEGERIAATIADPSLREAVARAAAASLAAGTNRSV